MTEKIEETALDVLDRAREAYRQAHPRQADAVDEAMARGPQDSEEVVAVPADGERDPFSASSGQLTLDGSLARDEAIERVERNADPVLIAQYERLAGQLARTRPELTTDDLEEAAERAGLPVPSEKRVFGPIMLRLSKRKMIERTERTVLSARAANHRRPIRVWRSIAYYEQR